MASRELPRCLGYNKLNKLNIERLDSQYSHVHPQQSRLSICSSPVLSVLLWLLLIHEVAGLLLDDCRLKLLSILTPNLHPSNFRNSLLNTGFIPA